MSSKKLFSEFAPVSKEQWIAKATEDLKGADFQKKLVWRTYEGFDIQPFYTIEDLEGRELVTNLNRLSLAMKTLPEPVRGSTTPKSW